jgi:phosphatidylserine decarboxylase
MEKLSDFLKKPDVQARLKKPIPELLSVDMNRDPMRAIHANKRYFLSPADGFVIYVKEVDPDEDIINVKGGEYTVNTLLREEIKERCLVIGIFMTCIDVHVNRAPTNGYYSYEKLPCLKVTNLSMRPIEKSILEELKINHNEMKYSFYNETMKNKIMVPYLNQSYWLLQIADWEVDVVCPFSPSGQYFTQGERFSLVRLGSQVDVIIPIVGENKFRCLVPDDGIYHLTAGVDNIVEVL